MWFDELERFDGTLTERTVDIREAIPIGKYLNELRYQEFKEFQGEQKSIGVVQVNGLSFIIDGRNRAKANYDKGIYLNPAHIMESESKNLEDFLLNISEHTMSSIPVLNKEQRQQYR
jgi:hypothetical protein